MSLFGDLKFDNMEVNTEEASNYLEQHNYTFDSIGYESSDESSYDLYKNTINFANYTRIMRDLKTEIDKRLPDVLISSPLSENLNKLVEDIKLKWSLLAGVEYMMRDIPMEQTISCDLKLIIQNLMYVSASLQHKFYKSNVLVMRENSPLATLGFVAQLLCAHNKVIIESTETTAVVCHLFTTMCHNAGLDKVKLAFVEKPSSEEANDVTILKELQPCCAAVVTGSADIDSAVDAIIGAPNSHPWCIRRVFVQECVGGRFLRALGWKAGLNGVEGIKEFAVNGKLFAHECTTPFVGIHIEEYRTVKELLCLAKDNVPLATSVWCSDVCEANELAHGLASTLVWINCLMQFTGPPAASQAFYSILDTIFASRVTWAPAKRPDSERWLKLVAFKRRDVILRAMRENNIKVDVPHEPEGGFASVDRGLLCVGIHNRVLGALCCDDWQAKDILSALMVGSTVFIDGFISTALNKALQASGVPVYDITSDGPGLYVPSIFSMYKTKVVWTSFGTSFAN